MTAITEHTKFIRAKKIDTQKESEEDDDCNSNNEETTMPNSSKKTDNYITDSLIDFILCTDQSLQAIMSNSLNMFVLQTKRPNYRQETL